MNKRIMTVDELYAFCLQNNFAKFESSETDSELVVEMHGHFAKDENSDNKFSEGLTPFVSRAFHDKINLNKSKIETDVFEENLPSSHLRPILANIVRDEETGVLDFGSHDYHVEKITETDKNGNKVEIEKIVYDEQPIGVIDGSKNAIEYDAKADVNRAVLHGYLYDGYCQDAIDILNRRGTVDCSVELSIRAMSFDTSTNTLVLDDFYVSALTLLSEKTKPGMAGSNFKIEDFEVKENKDKFSKDEKIVELLESISHKLSESNKTEQFSVQNDSKKGGDKKDMSKFEELLSKYNKTAEDVTFDYAEMSDEELEAKFAEMFNDEAENENKSFEKLVRTYEISHEDVRHALYSLLAPYEESDNDYYYICNVYDSYFVYEGWCTDNIYRQGYNKDGDNVSLEGERIPLFRMLLTESEKAELESMRAEYTSLKEFKENTEFEKLHEERENLANSERYSILAQKDENGKYINSNFEKLMNEIDNYSLTDLETKLKVMHSDYTAEHASFSSTLTEEKKSVVSKKQFVNVSKKSTTPSRYGKLFKEQDK
jgi:hypothetical protein